MCTYVTRSIAILFSYWLVMAIRDIFLLLSKLVMAISEAITGSVLIIDMTSFYDLVISVKKN